MWEMSGASIEPIRHCERSEAIQESFRGNSLDCFVAFGSSQ